MGYVQSIDIPPTMVKSNEAYGENEGPVYHSYHIDVENGGNFISTFRSQPESRTAIDLLKASSVKFAKLDCVGERQVINSEAGSYKYISYEVFYERCLAFGRGLLTLGLKRGEKIGIYSNNSIWWQIAAFGAYSVGLTIVPIYDSLGPNASKYIVEHAEVKIILANSDKLPISIDLAKNYDNISHIISITNEKPNLDSKTPVIWAQDLLETGRESNSENIFSKPEDVAVIMYTSGSTGDPKGCVLLHSNIIAGAAGLGNVNASVSQSDTYLSFLPLAHIYALCVEIMMYAQGVRVGFARGPVPFLLDDIKNLQPTILCVVPRILNRVVEGMKKKIEGLSPLLRGIIGTVIKSKISNLKENKPNSLLLDGVLFKEFRNALGGRVRCIVSGGAPIIKEVFEFLSATITPNIIQGYGLTEVSSCVSVQSIPAINPATVGTCALSCEIKLRKVEGTAYDPLGVIPRGELLVRGPNVFQGYYKRPDLTEEVLSKDGWFATGDVVQITPDNQIQIIDRAKQLVKLAQGEYISLTTLTDVYTLSDFVSFIYVYANSFQLNPVAVVVPKPEKIKEWENKGIKDIPNNKDCQKELIDSLDRQATFKNLRGFEKIKSLLIDLEEPTIASGLLTPSMKPQFNSLKKKYEENLLKLYEELKK